MSYLKRDVAVVKILAFIFRVPTYQLGVNN